MDNYMMEISAVVGAVMIVARVVVLLTPTPRDDAALKKVAGWLKVVAAVTGLNLKQGLKKYEK